MMMMTVKRKLVWFLLNKNGDINIYLYTLYIYMISYQGCGSGSGRIRFFLNKVGSGSGFWNEVGSGRGFQKMVGFDFHLVDLTWWLYDYFGQQAPKKRLNMMLFKITKKNDNRSMQRLFILQIFTLRCSKIALFKTYRKNKFRSVCSESKTGRFLFERIRN